MKKFNEIGDPNDAKMPLSAKNYVLLLVGAAVILLGMFLMGGFAFEIYAILKRW